MAQAHMTEAEVSGNFAAVLKKIGHGEEIVVDRDGQPVAIIRPPAERKPRTLSQLSALAGQREKDRGFAIPLDEDYAADIEHIVRERKPWIPRSWE
jgi:antitoxin (DNA-binding transcriptional repressor) of toxin-antitoxin stability system